MLRNCLPQTVRRVLSELPASLDETFEHILKEIGPQKKKDAYRLLQCLCVAARPLRLEELAEILAPDFHKTKRRTPNPRDYGLVWRDPEYEVLIYDEPGKKSEVRRRDREYEVLSSCSSLIMLVDNGHSRVVQFSHFSIKQFLTSDRLATSQSPISHFHIASEAAHTTLTQACLATLLRLDSSSSNDQVERDFHLARYASQHWVEHAQFEMVSSQIKDGIQHLFDPTKPFFSMWLRLYNIDDHWNRSGNAWVARGSPLYYASLCGFRELAEHIIKGHPEQVNATGGRRHSPLAAALSKGHFHVAELLLQHGASVNVTDYDSQTLLQAASVDGRSDVTRWLLDHGADMNTQQDDLAAPIHLATVNGHLEVIRMLLEYEVNIDSADKDGRTPLHLASSSGKVEIVRLLLDRGANANAVDKDGCTPLILTWTNEVEDLLLNYGASPGENGGSTEGGIENEKV